MELKKPRIISKCYGEKQKKESQPVVIRDLASGRMVVNRKFIGKVLRYSALILTTMYL